jgi:cation diffusion facilitator CzcD-associated flavoprotein CzcO
MPVPSPHSLAIVGAGPVGLEAACAALDAGLDAHVFERGEVGAHPIAWGHVRMFTPWSMNLGPSTRARLEHAGWSAPEAGDYPTGLELARRYVEPAAALPELKDRVHTHAQVVHIGRRGLLKGDSPSPALRRQHPFRLLVRDAGGRENLLHAFAVLDASGVYGQPNWAGDGGIPARGELYLAPQMSYHVDDVLGLRRERYAGKRTIVIGSGASAATLVADLATLSEQAVGTTVAWLTRKPKDALYADIENDPLPGRRALHALARDLVRGTRTAVTHVGGVVVEGFEFNSATHRYRVLLRAGEDMRTEEADQVIVAAGYGPDNSLYRELQFHECYASRGPMKLAAALRGANAADCLSVPAFGVEALESPEPDFFLVGHKSYGRTSHFLLETGYRQVADVIAKLAREQAVATPS